MEKKSDDSDTTEYCLSRLYASPKWDGKQYGLLLQPEEGAPANSSMFLERAGGAGEVTLSG